MKHTAKLLILCIFLAACGDVPKIKQVETFKLESKERYGDFLISGHSPGVGSGLTLIEEKSKNELRLWSIADSGSTLINRSGEKLPFYAEILIKDKVASVTTVSPLKGLPDGFDGEGIALSNKGTIWIADELIPSLIVYDPEKQEVVQEFLPGHGLPKEVEGRRSNRGLEGLAITPSGKALAALQSPLSGEKWFIRLVWIDPFSNSIRQFAYGINQELFPNTGGFKIGALTALNEDEFLLIEQGPGENSFANRIIRISLDDAVDISGLEASEIDESYFIEGELISDLRNQGWEHEKAEGLSVGADGRTVFIINDIDTRFDRSLERKFEPLSVYLWKLRFDRPLTMTLSEYGLKLLKRRWTYILVLILIALYLLRRRRRRRKRRTFRV